MAGRVLVPQPGIEPVAPCTGNYWTTRKSQKFPF